MKGKKNTGAILININSFQSDFAQISPKSHVNKVGSKPKLLGACLAKKFLAKFVFYKFLNNFIYKNLKKLFKVFKLYTSKYQKIYTLQKIFL